MEVIVKSSPKIKIELATKVVKAGGGDVKADGVYPDLTAGDLAGRGESVPAEFGFRASGGKSIKDGRAYIKRIKGNSVVWNQIMNIAQNWSIQFNNDVFSRSQVGMTYIASCNDFVSTEGSQTDHAFIIESGVEYKQGHKYLIVADLKAKYVSDLTLGIYDGTDYRILGVGGGSASQCSYIYEPASTFVSVLIRFDAEISTENYGKAQTLELTPRIYDLTQMFQAGNEPSTIEEFNARVATLGIDMYAYNEGQVIHCNTESIKSVGDNALNADRSLVFDFVGSYENYDFINTEDAFVGISADGYINKEAIDYAEKIEGGFRLRSNAGGYGIGLFVKALPNEEYSVSYASDNGRIAFGFYDKGKNLISYELWENRFTTPSNCEYIMLCLRDNEVTNIDISFTDIMLTLVHSGWKQDTDAGYQPYWQDILPMPIIRKYFPDGMKKAGTAHDEIRFNKASGKWEKVVRIGSVDMGTLYWELDGGTFYTVDERYFAKMGLLSSRYTNITSKDESMNMYAVNGILRAFNSAYTDAASFKSAMQGVMLYYELAEPIVTEITEDFRDYYNVADFGTEMSQSSVPSAPFSADIIYQFNAVDMIREHEMEITELQNIIATMQAQLASLINNNA